MCAIWKFINGHLRAEDATGRLIYQWEASEIQGSSLVCLLNDRPALSNRILAPWLTYKELHCVVPGKSYAIGHTELL